MKIAFIHNDKKIGTGAHYINDLMSRKLRKSKLKIKNFYPRISLVDAPNRLNGIKNILHFYSLLERRDEILKYGIIQGTTYTPLPFLTYPVPVISHFGSTTRGFINTASEQYFDSQKIKPLQDIADIEEYVAKKATAVIATSTNVKKELIDMGVKEDNIHLIHNAIEDYWFKEESQEFVSEAGIVFLGRLGDDFFTLRLKGFDRLVKLYNHFPDVKKTTICMSNRKSLITRMDKILNHVMFNNVQKDKIPNILKPLKGSILFLPSRYEGFSLSLVEGMSQGLVPVAYPVGVAPEIIRNGKNGFLVHSQFEAIGKVKLLLSNKTFRENLSIEASKTAQQFSSDKITQKLVNLYGSLYNC